MLNLPLPSLGRTWPEHFTACRRRSTNVRKKRSRLPYFTVIADRIDSAKPPCKILAPLSKYINQGVLHKMEFLLDNMDVNVSTSQSHKCIMALPDLVPRARNYVQGEILSMDSKQQQSVLEYIESIKISGRSLDMLLIETLRLKTIHYMLYNRTGKFYSNPPGKPTRFYLTASYRVMLKKYTKTFFDCFARGTQIYINDAPVAICQFLFFKWAQKYCVYEFFYHLLIKKTPSLAPRAIKKVIQQALAEYKTNNCMSTCTLTTARKGRYATCIGSKPNNTMALIQEHLHKSRVKKQI